MDGVGIIVIAIIDRCVGIDAAIDPVDSTFAFRAIVTGGGDNIIVGFAVAVAESAF